MTNPRLPGCLEKESSQLRIQVRGSFEGCPKNQFADSLTCTAILHPFLTRVVNPETQTPLLAVAARISVDYVRGRLECDSL